MHPGDGARRARRAWAAAAALTAVLLAVAGCGPDTAAERPPKTATASSQPLSRASLTLSPADGASDVPPRGGVRVTVAHGRLTSVRLADDRGRAVPGRLGAGATSWEPDGPLALATPYTLDAVAEDSDGLVAARHAAFTTLVPQHTLVAFYTPEAGATVGVGMPVSLRFTRPVEDRAAVERAVRVVTDPPVEVAGHWFGARRLDFRPRHFWRPGTRVVLSLLLRDVQAAPGLYGVQRKDVPFTVGRAQISTVDIATRRMTVRRAGGVLRTLPVSAGSPEHATYAGILVISEKYPVTRMNSHTVGLGSEYDIPDVPHALRLTGSGTFVHGNYWAPRSVFGAANTSHGCVGLADVKGGGPRTPAGWFYQHSLVGDVVRVVNADGGTVAPDNGFGDWNLTWEQWLAGSALPHRPTTPGE